MQQGHGNFVEISAPYWYLKDPDDCYKFIIDDYASNIIKKTFNMTVECKSKN